MTDMALMLESFGRPGIQPLPQQPCYSRDDLEAARAEGEAAGMAMAKSLGLAALMAAVSDLAAAVQDDEARYRAMIVDFEKALAELVSAVVAVLAPAYRAEVLAEATVALLARQLGEARRSPPILACEAESQPMLRAALDEAGLRNIEITTIDSDSGARLVAPGGLLSIDLDHLRSELDHIINEMKAGAA